MRAAAKGGRTLMTKVWRERVTYTAMSLLVVWHTLAMVVAPGAENSELIRALRTVFNPYLRLFKLDNQWGFFAPEVANGMILRYVIKDPDAGLNWFHPSSIWLRAWYVAVLEGPDDFGEEFGALFCRQHAELHPATITLFEVDEQDYSPQDRLRGKQPLDPEFVKVAEVKSFECPH
jgi:hypothetical protein